MARPRKDRDKLLTNGEFFNLLGRKMNYSTPEMAKQFYYSFLKLVTHIVRVNGVCRIPDFGLFRLRVRKGSRLNHFAVGPIDVQDSDRVLNLKFDYKLKEYFKNCTLDKNARL